MSKIKSGDRVVRNTNESSDCDTMMILPGTIGTVDHIGMKYFAFKDEEGVYKGSPEVSAFDLYVEPIATVAPESLPKEEDPTPDPVDQPAAMAPLPRAAMLKLNRIAKQSGQSIDTVASVIIGSFLAQQPAKAKRKAAAK